MISKNYSKTTLMTLCPNALISTPLHAAIFLQLQKKRNKTKKVIIKILRT